MYNEPDNLSMDEKIWPKIYFTLNGPPKGLRCAFAVGVNVMSVICGSRPIT